MALVWTPGEALEALGEAEYCRRVVSERLPPKHGGTVLVGERANAQRATMEQYCDSVEARLRCGCFLWGPSRDRLTGLGLRWDAALNLLPARPTREATWGSEDRRWARACCDALYARALRDGWRLLLCGQRVAWAAGVRFVPLAVGGHRGVPTLVLPHPSGLSRWWNERDNLDSARLLFARLAAEDWLTLG